MKIKNVNIKGLKIIKTKMFFDKRGFFKEIFKSNLIKKDFKFDVMILMNLGDSRLLDYLVERGQKRFFLIGSSLTDNEIMEKLDKKDIFFSNYFLLYNHNLFQIKSFCFYLKIVDF